MGKKVEAVRFWGHAGGLISSGDLLWLTPGTSLLAGIETLTKAQREQQRWADNRPITER